MQPLIGHRTKLSSIWWALPILLSYGVLCVTPLREGDLWWHLRLGEAIVMRRALPMADELTLAGAGLSFNSAHSWLSEVVLYVMEAAGGLSALVMLQALIAALTLTLLQRLSYLAGAAAKGATALNIVGFLALYPFSTARPQIFSFLMFVCVEAVLLSAHNGRPRWMVALPALMALWTNLHGAWAMGLGLVGVFLIAWLGQSIAGSRAWRTSGSLLLWGGAAILATLVNPEGWRAYEYLTVIGTSPVSQQYVSEWQPPTLSQTFTWPFWLLLLVAGLLVVLHRPRRWDTSTMAALCFAVAALRYVRMIPFAVIALLPALATRLPAHPAMPERRTAMNSSLLGVLVVASALTTPCLRSAAGASQLSFIDPYFPVTACDVLAQQGAGAFSVFTLAEWGGFVEWRLAPDARPFVDGRVELFPVEVWEDYLHINTVRPGWEALLERWGFRFLLLSTEREGQLEAAALSAGWQVQFQDEGSILLERP